MDGLYEFCEFLASPIVGAAAMTLVSINIFLFWRNILSYRRNVSFVVSILAAVFNGVVIFAAANAGLGPASISFMALYIPVVLVLEILIMGHLGIWGTMAVLIITSFQFVTLYSAAVGVVNMVCPVGILAGRMGLDVPVTVTNLLFSAFMTGIAIYKKIVGGRTEEFREVFVNPRKSIIIVIYCVVNTLAVAGLLKRDIDALYNRDTMDYFMSLICTNMCVRDIILFLSTVLMLDVQTRNLRAERYAQRMKQKNDSLQNDVRIQRSAQEVLREKNRELSMAIEREKELRKKLRRNVLFSLTANLTERTIVESGRLNAYNKAHDYESDLDMVLEVLIGIMARDEAKEMVKEILSNERLLTLADSENNGFEFPFEMSPKDFLEQVAIDDEAARIFAYKDREYIWTSIDCSVIKEVDGDVYAYFYILDVDERKQQEETVRKEATTDSLTGLYNRREFTRVLDEYLSKEGASGALFMLDLDHFKNVNDTFGHPRGDELLKDVAGILTKTFRSDDLICRIGGDEFCCFAKGLVNEELVTKRAEYLNEVGKQWIEAPGGEKVRVSFSLGVAIYPRDAEDGESLYANADSCLYKAKNAGRNCYRVYSSQDAKED